MLSKLHLTLHLSQNSGEMTFALKPRRVVVLRHGCTNESQAGILQGSEINTVINREGRKQVRDPFLP